MCVVYNCGPGYWIFNHQGFGKSFYEEGGSASLGFKATVNMMKRMKLFGRMLFAHVDTQHLVVLVAFNCSRLHATVDRNRTNPTSCYDVLASQLNWYLEESCSPFFSSFWSADVWILMWSTMYVRRNVTNIKTRRRRRRRMVTQMGMRMVSHRFSLSSPLSVISLEAIWVLAQVYFKFVVQSSGCSFIWSEVNL